MSSILEKEGFICDMDGVLYHGNHLLPGALEFIEWLKAKHKKYLFLTNSSERSPRELSQKLKRLGLDVDESHFYTSALATASFLSQQKPGGSAFVIGEAGLIQALYQAGLTMNNVDPDYVVIGETRTYSFEKIEEAVRLINNGAVLIGTNPDLTGPTEFGIVPATGSLVKPIELATGRTAYFLGKPNPLMMRHAMKMLATHREQTVIIGDRMDTDIIAGIETECETILVLSGVTQREDIRKYGYKPTLVLNGIGEIPSL